MSVVKCHNSHAHTLDWMLCGAGEIMICDIAHTQFTNSKFQSHSFDFEVQNKTTIKCVCILIFFFSFLKTDMFTLKGQSDD